MPLRHLRGCGVDGSSNPRPLTLVQGDAPTNCSSVAGPTGGRRLAGQTRSSCAERTRRQARLGDRSPPSEFVGRWADRRSEAGWADSFELRRAHPSAGAFRRPAAGPLGATAGGRYPGTAGSAVAAASAEAAVAVGAGISTVAAGPLGATAGGRYPGTAGSAVAAASAEAAVAVGAVPVAWAGPTDGTVQGVGGFGVRAASGGQRLACWASAASAVPVAWAGPTDGTVQGVGGFGVRAASGGQRLACERPADELQAPDRQVARRAVIEPSTVDAYRQFPAPRFGLPERPADELQAPDRQVARRAVIEPSTVDAYRQFPAAEASELLAEAASTRRHRLVQLLPSASGGELQTLRTTSNARLRLPSCWPRPRQRDDTVWSSCYRARAVESYRRSEYPTNPWLMSTNSNYDFHNLKQSMWEDQGWCILRATNGNN